MMKKGLLMGLGLGLLLFPVSSYVAVLPILGDHTTVIYLITGFFFLLKGVFI